MDDLPCRNARVRLWAAGLLIMAAAGGCADSEVITGTDAEASAATGWDWSSTYTVPAVTCLPASAAHLQTVNCNITEPEFATFEVLAWKFDTGAPAFLTVERPTSTAQSWSGPVVVSGTVTVQVKINGVVDYLTDEIEVTRRTWSWKESVGGQAGVQGEIDQCLPTDSVAGFTSGKSCASTHPNELFTPMGSGGYSVASVSGDGPNGGLRYPVSPTLTMDLRTQINKRFRSDADTLDVPMTGDPAVVNACQPQGQRKTHFFVNTDCAPRPAFNPYLTYVWNHEALHVDSAVVAAKKPTGDVHALWEPLVSKSQPVLVNKAEMVRDSAEAKIRAFAACSHTGVDTTFVFWVNLGGGWWDTQVSGGESRAPHCPPF